MILCGEWVPSEWASKQLINTEVIHTPPVHQLMSWEEKSYVPGKKSISCCVSHQNPHTFTLHCKRLHCFLGLFWWIMDLYFSWKQQFTVKNVLMDLFLTELSFWLLRMLTDGLEWCGFLVNYCNVFISCSDGTHSPQRIHWVASDGMLHFSKSVKKSIKRNILHVAKYRINRRFIYLIFTHKCNLL